MAPRFRKQILFLFLGICVGSVVWLYVHKVLQPWIEAQSAHERRIKAQMWDLYPRWVGTRNLFLYGRSPYSIETSHEIQMAFYGHFITPQDFTRPPLRGRYEDEQRFAYPIYVVFLMAPTIYLDFSRIEAWAPVALGVIAAATALFAVLLLDWDLPPLMLVSLLLLVVGSPQIEQAMRHQQLSIVVGLALTGAGWCVHKNHLATAGLMLAVATIKPQMAVLPIAWFLTWASGEWRRRWRLVGGFAGTMAIFVGMGEVLAPGWVGDFIAGIEAYNHYFPTTSILGVILGNTFGYIVGIFIVLATLVLGWKNRGVRGDSQGFVIVFAFFLMMTIVAFPLMILYNHSLLILPAVLVLHQWSNLSKVSRIIFSALISWSWITAAGLLLISPPVDITNKLPLMPGYPAAFMPLVLPALLYGTLRTQLSDGRYEFAAADAR
jgi:MFS family permease